MKTLKKLTALLLVGAMAISMAACGSSKKKVTAKEFKKSLEKADFVVEEGEDEDADEKWSAAYHDGDSYVYIDYYVFESKKLAKKCFNDSYDELKEVDEDGDFEGDIEKNSWRFTGDGDFSEDTVFGERSMFVAGVLAEETVLICYSSSDKTGKKVLKKVLADFGYEI